MQVANDKELDVALAAIAESDPSLLRTYALKHGIPLDDIDLFIKKMQSRIRDYDAAHEVDNG